MTCVLLGACGLEEPAEPPLTADEQAELEAALARAAGKADGAGLGTYRSRYVNMTIAGRTEAGATFALVAGKHDQYFPYFDPRSKWDNLLLLVGDEALVASARELAGLAIEVPDQARGLTRVRFYGAARRADGTSRQVSIELALDHVRFDAVQLGKRYNFLDLDEIPGLRWQPHALTARTGSIEIDGARARLAAVAGEVEIGRLTNLRAPEFALAYAYLAVAHADPSEPAPEWYAHVTFTSYALHAEGVLGRLVDWYARTSASETLTLRDGRRHTGNDRGVAPERVVVLASDVIDLGPATLDRQLVATTDARGRTAYGLREIFTRK
jgi:hypothetical protein